LWFVPAAIVLVIYCGYSHPLVPVLSLLTALGAYGLYVRLAPEAPAWRGATLLMTCLAVYYAAGAGSLLFAVLAAIDELLIGKRKRLAAAALGCGLVVPAAAGTLFGLSPAEIAAGFLASAPGVAPQNASHVLALFLFFPTVLAGSILWRNERAGATPPPAKPASKPARRPRKGDPPPVPKPRRNSGRRVPAWTIAVAFVVGVGAIAWLSLDSRTRAMLEMDYFAERGQWEEVLLAADRLPQGIYSVRCNRNILQALYHTDRLGDELFRYPQRRGVDLFFTPAEFRDLGSYSQEGRLFFDVGQVNLAERCGYEALATSGEEPAVLERMARVNLVKGRPATARMFLSTLAQHPFYRRTAWEMLGRLEADATWADDPQVARARANMAARDSIVRETRAEEFLQILLEQNPHNKMAFELLMAHYLCEGRPDKAVENLPRLKDFSYSRVPRYYQEALVIHTLSTGRPPRSPGFEIDPAVLQRAEGFRRIVAGAANPQAAVAAAREAGLDDSYFFYLAYGISGR
jgi:tetratricopeptide (TPR) repeat protein